MGKLLKTMLTALIIAVPLCTSCGKRDLPRPVDKDVSFAFAGAVATMDIVMKKDGPRRCLTVTTDISGAADNVDGLVIELEAQTGGLCEGCPFLPTETSPVSPVETIRAPNVTRHVINYCPRTQAQSYRWRLIAKHRDSDLPNVLGNVYGPVR